MNNHTCSHTCDHKSFGIASKAVSEKPRQYGVSVRDVHLTLAAR